jgi:predicted nucleotidyltransferase
VSSQQEQLVALLQDVLGEELVGAYWHGSAVLGGPGPRSDLDVLVVSRRATTPDERRRLVEKLLRISVHPDRREGRRTFEVTFVVKSDVRPWRSPPRWDMQYGEWWRDRFEAGDFEPWETTTDPDLALLVTVAVNGNEPLFGPPPAEVFGAVPQADLERAMLHSIDHFFAKFDDDTANTLLMLSRVWTTLATGEIRRKDKAADWALARLPAEHRSPLERAHDVWSGEAQNDWSGDRLAAAHACADVMVNEIERLRAG